ncbi:protease modulator HflC [Faunimonas sp. B44]|uniref:protease modulator HflC n=1 Tax=Faunimonas sp. B44 TaxID=3461493 RepID=UPI004043DE17
MIRIYAAIAALVALFLVWSSIFIVNEREQAVVLRFGQITRVIEQPGLYFKAPTNFVDAVQIIDDRILNLELENIRVQVRDGRRYLVDAFVAFHIVDAREFRQNVSGSLTLAEENLRTRLDAALRRVYGQRSFEAALSDQRLQMMIEVRDQLRPLAAELGIDVVDVRILRTDLLPEVSQQTFERMRAERLAEAAQLRARGTQEAARIRAEADREAVVTVAEAERDGEILRGQGDADRIRILAEAFGLDPGFYDFYRSMRAYSTSLEGAGTTMVLTPDSEFFRYFRESGVEQLPPPNPNAVRAVPRAVTPGAGTSPAAGEGPAPAEPAPDAAPPADAAPPPDGVGPSDGAAAGAEGTGGAGAAAPDGELPRPEELQPPILPETSPGDGAAAPQGDGAPAPQGGPAELQPPLLPGTPPPSGQ